MQNKFFLMAAVAGLALSSPANSELFNGPYVGANLGYSWGDVDYDYEDGTTGFGDFSDSEDLNGFEGGVFAGYRHKFPSNFVLGAEAGYDLSNVDGSYSTTIGANNARVDFEKNHQFYVDLKPGFMVQENTLAYALVGYQRAELESETFLNGATLGSQDDDFDAWRIGVGVEHAVNERFSVRGQYYYADYSDNDYDYANAQRETYGGDESALRVGAVLNF